MDEHDKSASDGSPANSPAERRAQELAKLLRLQRGALLAWQTRRVRNPADAEDDLQDACLRLLAAEPREGASVAGGVFRRAMRCATADRLRPILGERKKDKSTSLNGPGSAAAAPPTPTESAIKGEVTGIRRAPGAFAGDAEPRRRFVSFDHETHGGLEHPDEKLELGEHAGATIAGLVGVLEAARTVDLQLLVGVMLVGRFDREPRTGAKFAKLLNLHPSGVSRRVAGLCRVFERAVAEGNLCVDDVGAARALAHAFDALIASLDTVAAQGLVGPVLREARGLGEIERFALAEVLQIDAVAFEAAVDDVRRAAADVAALVVRVARAA